MLIDWLWLVQTQSGQAGYQGRQLCIGAWTLLSRKPEVMVVPDCLTDFRYTGSQPAANPTYSFMHKGTVSADGAALLHHPIASAFTTSWSTCSQRFGRLVKLSILYPVDYLCACCPAYLLTPSSNMQAATPPYGCQGARTPLLRRSSPRSFQRLLRRIHVSQVLIAVCTHHAL